MSIEKILELIAYIHTPKSITRKYDDVGFYLEICGKHFVICYDTKTGIMGRLGGGLSIQSTWDKTKFQIHRWLNGLRYHVNDYDIAKSLGQYAITKYYVQHISHDKVYYPLSITNNLLFKSWNFDEYFKYADNLFNNVTTISEFTKSLQKQYDTIQRNLLVSHMDMIPKDIATIIGHNIYLLF